MLLNKKLSEEHKRKIGEANKGRKFTEETKRKMSEAHKGRPSWNKGKRFSEESRKKMSESKKGKPTWMKGKHHTEETKQKIKDKKKGKHHTEEHKRKISESHRGKIVLEKTKQKISEALKGNKNILGYKYSIERNQKVSKALKGRPSLIKGKNNPNWQGGISFEPYGLEFNKDLKEVIRNRDRRKCQICEKTELEEQKKLSIHHIDYDKKNNNPNNLITLCNSCHTKTGVNRNYWSDYFNVLIP